MGKTYTIKNPTDWANAFLGALGMPDTKTNVTNIVGWEAAEGGNWNNSAKYNPLNTEQPAPGSKSMGGGSKVQSYTSWQEGLDATVATIQQPGNGYPQILADLNTSQPWMDFSNAVSSSNWGTHLSGASPSSSGGTNSAAYSSGVTATNNDGSSANTPSTSKGNKKLQGFAGVLQEMDALYNPSFSKTVLGFIPNIPADIQGTATMLVVRGFSAILSVGLVFIGINTFIHGSSSSGSANGPMNVLEFVNNTQMQNRKIGLSQERVKTASIREADVSARHQQKLADKERERETHNLRSIRFATVQNQHAANRERELRLREEGKYSKR